MTQVADQPPAQSADQAPAAPPELTVLLPCLNEADTLGRCILQAWETIQKHGISAEILVADNGSSDQSSQIAASMQARLVSVPRQGYGHALMGGIEAARGKYIIIADADGSYDFTEIPRFLEKLRAGYDLVQGCRLPAGGGTVMPGAMPLLHRWGGNPLFTKIARWWFQAQVNDVYCGMRGFTRQLVGQLDLRSGGMEFAPEMVIKASRHQAAIAEVPITLHRDGRRAHRPHLRTFRDGWRTLRFFLMYSPRWLFLEPGKFLVLMGLIGYVLALPGFTIGGVNFGLNTLVCASLAILCGNQCIFFAIGTKALVVSAGLLPADARIERFFRYATLERGLAIGTSMLLVGIALILVVVRGWWMRGFGDLHYDYWMRWMIPGAMLTAVGVQVIFSSFFISIIGNLDLAARHPPRSR